MKATFFHQILRILSVLFLFFVVFASGNAAEKQKSNESVLFQIKLKEKGLKPGSKGTVLIKLHPKKGLHINLETPTSIKFDSIDIIRPYGNLVLPKNANNNYLDTSKYIQQQVTVSKTARKNAASLKGVFTYYYCSDEEGWCSKFKQSFELKINIIE